MKSHSKRLRFRQLQSLLPAPDFGKFERACPQFPRFHAFCRVMRVGVGFLKPFLFLSVYRLKGCGVGSGLLDWDSARASHLAEGRAGRAGRGSVNPHREAHPVLPVALLVGGPESVRVPLLERDGPGH